MKTPLEALDAAISALQSVRMTVATATSPGGVFTATTGMLSLHFHRPKENASDLYDSKALARAIGGDWINRDGGCWESCISGVSIFIHNAEPARNPQPETVEL